MNEEPNNSELDRRSVPSTRSNAYPSATIEDILELIRKLKKAFQNASFTGEDVASAVKKNYSTIKRDISSAVQYGLLDKSRKDGYKITELAKLILEPLSEDEKLDNLTECFKRPKIYNELINRYRGEELPDNETLQVVIARYHGIMSNATKQAIDVFIENGHYTKLINKERVLLPTELKQLPPGNVTPAIPTDNEGYQSEIELAKPVDSIIREPEETPKQQQFLQEINGGVSISIRLTEKKQAKLIYPENMNERDVEILRLQLDVIKMSLSLD